MAIEVAIIIIISNQIVKTRSDSLLGSWCTIGGTGWREFNYGALTGFLQVLPQAAEGRGVSELCWAPGSPSPLRSTQKWSKEACGGKVTIN